MKRGSHREPLQTRSRLSRQPGDAAPSFSQNGGEHEWVCAMSLQQEHLAP